MIVVVVVEGKSLVKDFPVEGGYRFPTNQDKGEGDGSKSQSFRGRHYSMTT